MGVTFNFLNIEVDPFAFVVFEITFFYKPKKLIDINLVLPLPLDDCFPLSDHSQILAGYRYF